MTIYKHIEEIKEIKPIFQPIRALVHIPGSKSQTNRALLAAALAEGVSVLTNTLFSDDSMYFANALRTLGYSIILDEKNARMTIAGLGGSIPAKKADLFIGNAGTAARFLTALLTLGDGIFTLDGDSRMRERPICDLVHALNELGAHIEAVNFEHTHVHLPLRVTASGLSGGKTKISGDISSQFLSAILMIAPYADSAVEIEVTTKLNSRPYINLTLAVMADFGIKLSRDGYQRFSINKSRYSPLTNYVIESDASAASYFFAIPAICKGSVRVANINRNSKQGDIGFLDILSHMGLVVKQLDNDIIVSSSDKLVGVEVDMRDIPDTAQTLAAIAPFASTPTHIYGIASTRVKETDRISSTCLELQKLGVRVDEYDDGMTIYPTDNFNETTIQTYNDHRMAMAFSLIGLKIPGVRIENPGCVSKSFPKYFDVLKALR